MTTFVASVEAGGFARAADKLGLTRSAVAKSIARLEARLGVRLFHRTTRSQSLTEDGQLYLERCLRALAELREGERALSSGQREVTGRLRITMPALFGRHCVAPILLDLACEHPRLELDLHFSDVVVDLVRQGYDLAIRNGAPGTGEGLRTRRLASQQKTLCAAPGYLADRRPATPDDLAAFDALLYRWNGRPHGWSLQGPDGKLAQPRLRSRLRFDSYEAIADAAVRGMGIAWLPTWLVRDDIAAGRLVGVLEDHASPPLNVFAVWPETSFPPLRLRVAIEALAAGLPLMVGSA